MNEPIHRCRTKATRSEGEALRYSTNWITARRGVLYVFEDRLVCGDWTIPYAEIDEAVLFSVRQMFIPCHILRVRTRGQIFQFGLNAGRFWQGPLPFPVRRERGRLRYSWPSLALRLLLLGYVAYVLWKRFY